MGVLGKQGSAGMCFPTGQSVPSPLGLGWDHQSCLRAQFIQPSSSFPAQFIPPSSAQFIIPSPIYPSQFIQPSSSFPVQFIPPSSSSPAQFIPPSPAQPSPSLLSHLPLLTAHCRLPRALPSRKHSSGHLTRGAAITWVVNNSDFRGNCSLGG